jgi:hypothetical protein
MQYNSIAYTVRVRPGVDNWTWAIYPAGAPSNQGDTQGPRQLAERAAERAIDNWLEWRSRRSKIRLDG